MEGLLPLSLAFLGGLVVAKISVFLGLMFFAASIYETKNLLFE